MKTGLPIVYDTAKGQIDSDQKANALFQRFDREPWVQLDQNKV